MSDLISAITLKAQKKVELTEIVNDYIDRVESVISLAKALYAVRALLQPNQKYTFALYFKEAHTNIRIDIIKSMEEYYVHSQFTHMLDTLSSLSISQTIYNQLIRNGVSQYHIQSDCVLYFAICKCK